MAVNQGGGGGGGGLGGGIPPQQVQVQARLTGVGKMKVEWMDFVGNLMTPISVLAAGGTKAAAAWAGLKDVFTYKVLGPLGMVVGAATGFLMLTKRLVGQWKDLGMSGSKEIERLTLQFKPLLGSMAQARERAKELFEFGAKTPFEFPDVAKGGKTLEALTRGGLSTGKGLELVGDAAAVAGESFADMSRSIGRLYDGLMGGRAVGFEAMRLQELGVISGETRTRIEAMQAAGAEGNAVWKVAEKDIGRVAGAMKDMEVTLAAMESNYDDVKLKFQSGFSDGFLEGEKAGMAASIQMMDRLTPTMVELGQITGTVSNAWARFKAWVKDVATSIPGFTQAVTVAALAVTALASAVVMAAGGAIGKFIAVTLVAAQAQKTAAAAAAAQAVAQGVAAGSTGVLAAAQAQLVAALAAARAGKLGGALASLKLAAAETVAAFRANALAAAQAVVRGAILLTGKAVMFVTKQLWLMATAWLATPIGRIMSLVALAGAALLKMANATKQARLELEAYQQAAKASVATMDAQVRAIKTLADLRKTEADNLRQITAAYQEYSEAVAARDPAKALAAYQKLIEMQTQAKRIRGIKPADLEKDEAEIGTQRAVRQGAKDAEESRKDFEAGDGAAGKAQRAKEAYEEQRAKRAAAEMGKEQDEALAQNKREIQQAGADATARRPEMEARREQVEQELAMNENTGMGGAADNKWTYQKNRDAALNREELVAINAELAKMAALEKAAQIAASQVVLAQQEGTAGAQARAQVMEELAAAQEKERAAEQARQEAMGKESRQPGDAGARAAREAAEVTAAAAREELRLREMIAAKVEEAAAGGGASELAVLKEKMDLYAAAKQTADALAAAEKKLAEEVDATQGEDRGAADAARGKVAASEKAVAEAREEAALRAELAREAGVMPGVSAGEVTPAGFQAMEERRTELEAERTKDLDPMVEQEKKEAAITAEVAAAQERLDSEGRIAGYRLKGYEVEVRMLDIEEQKLDVVEKAGRMKEEDLKRARDELAARRAAAAEEAGRRRGEIDAALKISALRRGEEAARQKGNLGEMERQRAAADAAEDARTRRDALREAEEVTADPAEREGMADAAVRDGQAERADRRKREEEDAELRRRRSETDQQGGLSALKEELLRRQGKSKEADVVKEDSARGADEVKRDEAKRRFLDEGRSEDEATRMANTEVKTGQVQRLMEQLNAPQASVVASSLAEVGGGGRTYGGAEEKSLALLERIAKAIEEANDEDDPDVDRW